ncbi:glycosyltransferase family 4 protein [Terracoccus sp. 273MFTsu3.1]|uniref:glycosyltransferase family 4 protein n=1 Tax=Terracoccus sp. 273MFTsu3.1 TaxID=1172188 RepID=UPI00037A7E55|nr:glycosyltransferase family 4 protein [Terracoccus sp. 273MFTsu3.1]
MDPRSALEMVRTAPTLLEAMRAASTLADVTARSGGDVLGDLTSAARSGDPLTALAAVHALAVCGDPAAAPVLAELARDGRRHVAEHALDALRHTTPVDGALPHLVDASRDGGFTGMLAQRTLESWAAQQPDRVRGAVLAGLAASADDDGRARLAETLGLVPGAATTTALIALAADDTEVLPVRAAATAALGEGPAAGHSAEALLVSLARTVGPLAQTARLALFDLRPAPVPPVPDGLTVVQLFLHSDIDGRLHHSGQGDTGGIATLLVHLGDALLRGEAAVSRVITVSGGSPDPAQFPSGRPSAAPGAPAGSSLLATGHHYARVPLSGPLGVARAWPARVAARRGIRRVLRAAGRVDAIHLRMADVGSMAAAELAGELGIPVVLTVAPDPQALIDARDRAGTLTRARFGEADLKEHLWFRDHLLRDLAARASHLVLFPRPRVGDDLRRYLGIDVEAQRERLDVVGEGIDVAGVDRIVGEALDRSGRPRGSGVAAALDELDALLDTLPDDRRALPTVVSVGRLNPVKGMATLVRAWREDARLCERCNLLVVGGDLDHPSAEEAAELARIDAVVPPGEAADQGLLLAGHRPNATTIAWLARLRGRPGDTAPPGVYVSASLKEEFGIAILEAMAVGLVVVAPDGGGPATYVAHGKTGILTDTSTAAALASATHAALDLAAEPDAGTRAEQARDMVRTRFGIDTMAASLAAVYRQVAPQPHRGAHLSDAVEGAS